MDGMQDMYDNQSDIFYFQIEIDTFCHW